REVDAFIAAMERDVSPERDALEMAYAERALEREIPVLAICRGMQLLNVVRGGTLYQDLDVREGDTLSHDRFEMPDRDIHSVRFEETRWLRGVVPGESVRTNSAHHQGVRTLGEGIRPVAWAEDGLVEAVEIGAEEGGAWTVGVQWHPERMLKGAEGLNANLFRRFGKEVFRTARSRAEPKVSWESLAGA
ncbi:MAG: gamma-glutamyl-gamma-aminobutyrate hydrolase family protein, partial [Gemmatimonadota bacterium]